MSRDLFAREAIAQIPKILTLLDRNPHSPTYGCFDRNFWHYKIIDFPSGMSQEFVWPLALAYDTDIPDNPFYRVSAIRDLVEAGILYAARSGHRNGSCDDYFPYERAGGAAAFSLLACVESYILLGLSNSEALRFFQKRANWLATHNESGKLANHQALIVLCLELVSQLLQTSTWDKAKVQRYERLLSWQSEEGWFHEYEGCDPGYHTLTISCLARIYQFRQDDRLKEAIAKAVELAAQFVHPDGSYGGEYGSRNTYNFFPHGFELVGKWLPDALRINDGFLKGLANGLAPCYSDDHIIGHHTWNYFLAWRDFVGDRPPPAPRPTCLIWLKEAQILIDRRPPTKLTTQKPEDKTPKIQQVTNTNAFTFYVLPSTSPEAPSPQPAPTEATEEESSGGTELYVAVNKGGVFKLFRNNKLVASDTQFSVQVSGWKGRTAVAHAIDTYALKIEEDQITIQGSLGWAKQKQMTPLNLVILRVVMLTIGRFFPNLIRRILQTILITGKRKAPFRFYRRLRWENGRLCVTDILHADSWKKVSAVGIGCDQTSIYVAMSRTFQQNQLQPWLDLSEEAKKLGNGRSLRVDREF